MKIDTCFLLLLLGVTLIQAGPAPKITEKKSLAESSKAETTKENLKIEEAGEDKDRSKKSAFCLQIEPGSPQAAQFALNENQLALQNMPLTVHSQSIPQQVQSVNLVQPVPQRLSQANIVVPQQMVQPMSQPLSQANIVLPQQVVQPIHTLQIVQPPAQPCAQSAPKPNPIPVPSPEVETVPVTEQPKPMRMEEPPQSLPAPQEAVAVMPIVPAYQEQLMLIPEPEPATYIQVPSIPTCTNPLHGLVSECTCQKIEPMAMNMVSIVPYPAAYARSPIVMPHMVANQVKIEPQRRTSTHVNVNIPTHAHYPHLHQTMFQKTYLRGLNTQMSPYGANDLVDNIYAAKGIAINPVPSQLRGINSMAQYGYQSPEITLRNKQDTQVPSDVYDLMSSNKAPREVDSNQLSPENTKESNQEEGKAMLIDGRRNARSNKEETKDQKKQITKQ